jgi:hypothetical protein
MLKKIQDAAIEQVGVFDHDPMTALINENNSAVWNASSQLLGATRRAE